MPLLYQKTHIFLPSHKHEVSCLSLFYHERLSDQRSDVTDMGYDREINRKRISVTPLEKGTPPTHRVMQFTSVEDY